MNALMALILGAAPAPAFDVPIREISMWMLWPGADGLLEVTAGRCELRMPGQSEPTRVTARLNELHAEDLRSLLMVSLGQGYGATTWAPEEWPPNHAIRVTVSAPGPELLDPTFGWVTAMPLTSEGRLTEAWRLYSLFSLCNLGEAVDVWVALMDGPTQQRHVALAVVTEWMIWANREPDFVYALPTLVKDCREGRCEALPDALRSASRTWADSPSPRSFAPLERSPPVETPVNP